MKYYIFTIEQYKDTESGALVEGGKMYFSSDDYDTVLVKFYTRLSEIANSAVHNFLDIKIYNSEGGLIKKDSYGAYIDPDASQGE